jgi:hypothetical protein
MSTFKVKHVLSVTAALAVLAMVYTSVFADVTSAARSTHGVAHGHNFAAFVTALGL